MNNHVLCQHKRSSSSTGRVISPCCAQFGINIEKAPAGVWQRVVVGTAVLPGSTNINSLPVPFPGPAKELQLQSATPMR